MVEDVEEVPFRDCTGKKKWKKFHSIDGGRRSGS